MTAIEFALVAAPLMMLTAGTIEFGRLLWTRQALQLTAAEGARCMAVLAPSCASAGAYSSTSTLSYVETVASAWGIGLVDADITPSRSAAVGTVAGLSQVSISYTFTSPVMSLIPGLSSSAALTGVAYVPNWH